jgi:hypothetical protein
MHITAGPDVCMGQCGQCPGDSQAWDPNVYAMLN